jgi:tricorn protease
MMKRLFPALIFLTLFIGSELFAEEGRLLRYPNTSADQVTFSHGGDIYVAPLSGGLARRITSSEGYEIYPRFSPAGDIIAFSAEYDGNADIYTVPAMGGMPKRVTFSPDQEGLPARMGPAKIILQWSPDGSRILYSSREKSWNVLVRHLFWTDKDGGLPEQVPVPKSGFAHFNDDLTKMAYNRVFREYRTWKRYSGGQADEIWIYKPQTEELENISNTEFQDIIPMWRGDKIYYMSDRDFTMNLFSYNINTKETKKITNFTEFDVKFPSLGKNHIAFENGGYIYTYNLATEEVKKIDIQIAEDFPQLRPEMINVKDKIAGGDISPDGKRAVFVARGDIFTVPAKKGKIRNLTKSPGAHDRDAEWSPDGKWIAYISDETGEDEIYLIKPDGSDKMQLTSDAVSYRYGIEWSPDGKKILGSDKEMRLYYVDIATKKTTVVYTSPNWEITDYDWSPDSKWIAFTDYSDNMLAQVMLYNTETKSNNVITSSLFNTYSPEFAPGGKYLFVVSDRNFAGRSGAFEYNVTYNDMSTLFGITLQDTTLNPITKFEEDIAGEEEEKPRKIDIENPDPVNIDLENIEERIFELPVAPGNYGSLSATSKHRLYYVKREAGKKPGLYYYDFAKGEEKEAGDFTAFEFSDDEKSVIFMSGGNWYIESITDNIKPKDGMLDLSGMEYKIDRPAEWNQIFRESWRQMKYFFYDANMHGYDWNAIGDRYAQLVPYVRHRKDLTYVIGEMIGELDAGHAYVSGGDMPKVKAMPIGLLGADYEWDGGAYKITNILEGQNWEDKLYSPLTEPGLGVKVGDYLVAVDGMELTENYTPYAAMAGKAGEYVKLMVNSKPSMDGAREIAVKTIKDESELRYFNWIENNRLKVEEMTDGRIGYVHIPDMGFTNGLNWFAKFFYPQIRKEGLVIDDRYNGGGNVSPLVIERLRRELAVVKIVRNQDKVVMTTPNAVMTGPMVCLINQQSMSDGDLFPYQFRKMGLGPLIGQRTWGGVIGIRGSLPLLDGSDVRKPEFANFGADGTWILEDVGTKPDIEVDNHPAKEWKDEDEQLQRGVEEVLKQLQNWDKPQIPAVPPYPNKKENFGK